MAKKKKKKSSSLDKAAKKAFKTYQSAPYSAKAFMSASNDYMEMAQAAQQQTFDYNAEQAEIERNWQERMSATAHQREVDDLQAAGLSPVLSSGGTGAYTGSGASASAAAELAGVMGNLAKEALGVAGSLSEAMYKNASAAQTAYIAAGATKYASDKSKQAAEISASATRYSADRSKEAAEYSAQMHYAATVRAAEINRDSNIVATKLRNLTDKQIAEIAGKYNVKVADIKAAMQKYSAKLKYKAEVRGQKVKVMVERNKTITQELSRQWKTDKDNAMKLVEALIGLVDFF